jgi:hypothetical protein
MDLFKHRSTLIIKTCDKCRNDKDKKTLVCENDVHRIPYSDTLFNCVKIITCRDCRVTGHEYHCSQQHIIARWSKKESNKQKEENMMRDLMEDIY